MAKLFQNISLEERWRNSPYSQSPNLPKSVDQGSLLLKAQALSPQDNPIQLKIVSVSDLQRTLPIIKPLEQKTLSEYTIPFANTKFRTAISLSDRLVQSTTLSSTNHLPQYFLSDIFTDYIQITPFGIFTHTSDAPAPTFNFTPTQGGTSVAPYSFESLFLQGVTIVNGGLASYPVIEFPRADFIEFQGVTISNGLFQSFIDVDLSIPTSALQQYTDISVDLPISTQDIMIEQGIIIDSMSEMVSSIQVEDPIPTPNQGGVNPNQFTFAPPRTSPTLQVLRYEADRLLAFFAPRIKHGSTVIIVPEDSEDGSYTTAPITVGKDDSDFAASFYAKNPRPRKPSARDIEDGATNKHGGLGKISPYGRETGVDPEDLLAAVRTLQFFPRSTYLINNPQQEDKITFDKRQSMFYFTTVENIETDRYVKESDLDAINGLSKEKTTKGYFSEQENLQFGPGNKSLSNNLEQESLESYNFRNAGFQALETGLLQGVNIQQTFQVISTATERPGTKRLAGSTADTIAYNNLTEGITRGSISEYGTLTYNQISDRAGNAKPGTRSPDFRTLLKNRPTSVTLGTASDKRKSVDVILESGDFINIIVGGQVFKAFLTSFSDSITPSWGDIKYVGRQDVLKYFQSVTRTASIGFKVAAFKEKDLSTIYGKLKGLIKSGAVGAPQGTSLLGPITSITVGSWFINTPCVITSIKYDIQTADYSWDIDKKVPHIVDVNIDVTLIGDAAGNPLNSTTNKFLYF